MFETEERESVPTRALFGLASANSIALISNNCRICSCSVVSYSPIELLEIFE
jgi:hypothetical protein